MLRFLPAIVGVLAVGCGPAPMAPSVASEPGSPSMVTSPAVNAPAAEPVCFARERDVAPVVETASTETSELGHRAPAIRLTANQITCCYTGRDVIEKWIAPAKAKARSCYEAALGRDPKMAGRVVVTFELGADGRVSRACDDEPDRVEGLSDPVLEQCVVDAFGEVLAPEMEPPCDHMRIVYPLRFTPG